MTENDYYHARNWIADRLGYSAEEVNDMYAQTVLEKIQRHYPGGVARLMDDVFAGVLR